ARLSRRSPGRSGRRSRSGGRRPLGRTRTGRSGAGTNSRGSIRCRFSGPDPVDRSEPVDRSPVDRSQFSSEVGEKVLLLLERADDIEKPALIGRAFSAYMQGDVSLEQLERMTAGIDRALMADLRHLVNPKDGYVERTLGVSLMMSGLVMLMPNAAVGL